MTTALGGAKRLKLAKMMVSQNTSTARKGAGIGSVRLRKQQQTGFRQIGADLDSTGLKGALGVVPRGEFLYFGKGHIGRGIWFERRIGAALELFSPQIRSVTGTTLRRNRSRASPASGPY